MDPVQLEDLTYPEIETQLTHAVGILRDLHLTDDLKGQTLLIDKKGLHLFNPKNETEVIDAINNNLGKYHKFDSPKGTLAFYDFGSSRKEEPHLEAFEYFRKLSFAARVLTKGQCKLVYHFSFHKNSDGTIRFYKPFDFIESDHFGLSYEPSILKNKDDIERLNIIFKNLSKLPFANGENFNRLLNAITFTDGAQNETWIHMKTSLFFVALESLFSDDSRAEIAFKVCLRTACFLSEEKDRKERIFKVLDVGYKIRSAFLHGSKVDLNRLAASLKNSEKDYSAMFDFPKELNSIICDVLNRILSDEDFFELFTSKSKGDVLRFLHKIVL